MKILPMQLPPLAAASFDYDWSKEGYQLRRNTPLSEGVTLELAIPPAHWSLSELLQTAGSLDDCAGQLHGERLLRCRQSIPANWDQYDLFLLGTQWGFLRPPAKEEEIWIPRLSKAEDHDWELYSWCFQLRMAWWPRAAIVKIVRPGR